MYDKSPHKYDPRTNLHMKQAVWHDCREYERLVADIIERVKPTCWVETGTHMGWTCMWLAERYPELMIYTVERDDDFFQRASQNLAPYPNVKICHNDSRSFLWEMLHQLDEVETPIIFLDAHWNPPPPLKEECHAVSKLKGFVLLLDDFQCYQPDHSGDTFYSRASTQGQAYKNDFSYTASELQEADICHYRPSFPPVDGHNGIGLFVRGARVGNYVPPEAIMRRERELDFAEARAKTLREHPDRVLPLHPSLGF